jgi:hypothetical protein
MTKTRPNGPRQDGLYLMLLGSLALVLLGTVLSSTSTVAMIDFRAMYYPARCLIEHCDPYSESEVLRVAQAEGGERPSDRDDSNHFARYLYLPPTFSFTVPFAMMPWSVAHILLMALTGGGLILAGFLIWNSGVDGSPVIAGALIGFFLANSELLMVVGNIAGIAIVLCVVAVWCFVRDRFVSAGVLCLAISLAIKPHDSGLVWLYFLLAGGVYRKRALKTLLAAIAVSLPGLIMTWRVAPHWVQELHLNIVADTALGGRSDPAAASMGWHGLSMLVNLQTVLSAFWTDPHIYNLAGYLVCAPLLLVWAVVAFRSSLVAFKSNSPASNTWLALAAIAALSMLPLYHRQYDTKLLLLTVPACAMLWAERGIVGWLAPVLNTAGFIITGDLSWIAILKLIERLFAPANGLTARILANAQVFSAPLILLSLGTFYLWVYASRSSANTTATDSDSGHETPSSHDLEHAPSASSGG